MGAEPSLARNALRVDGPERQRSSVWCGLHASRLFHCDLLLVDRCSEGWVGPSQRFRDHRYRTEETPFGPQERNPAVRPEERRAALRLVYRFAGIPVRSTRRILDRERLALAFRTADVD